MLPAASPASGPCHRVFVAGAFQDQLLRTVILLHSSSPSTCQSDANLLQQVAVRTTVLLLRCLLLSRDLSRPKTGTSPLPPILASSNRAGFRIFSEAIAHFALLICQPVPDPTPLP